MIINTFRRKTGSSLAAAALASVIGAAALADAYGNNYRGYCVEERAHLGCVTEYDAALALANNHAQMTGHTVGVEQC